MPFAQRTCIDVPMHLESMSSIIELLLADVVTVLTLLIFTVLATFKVARLHC
jgi:hypothetical protein